MPGLKVLFITGSFAEDGNTIAGYIQSSQHRLVGILEPFAGKKPVASLPKDKTKALLVSTYELLTRQFISAKNYAAKNSIAYRAMYKGDKEDELEAWVRKIQPDVILIYSMPYLLAKKIYSLAAHGAINVHLAMLPKFRGPEPLFWSYYFFDRASGTTLHYINEGIDTGNIISQLPFEIPVGMRAKAAISQQMPSVAKELILPAFDKMVAGTLTSYTQPAESPTIYAGRIKEEQLSTLIDWQNWDVERIWHFMRGSENLLPKMLSITGLKLYQTLQAERYVVYNDAAIVQKTPGSIIAMGNYYCVQCRNGEIYVRATFAFLKYVNNLFS